VAFGEVQVALSPEMEWDQLARHSLADSRKPKIELRIDDVQELGRYLRSPYRFRKRNGVSSAMRIP
jgi:hypothetical protein